MDVIRIKLFNIPSVYINDEKVIFPFKKVEALFYYLLENKEATRDELVALLWPEEQEEIAKKNLRNAIYNIKKVFNRDIVISPQKHFVKLNEKINLMLDIECFSSNDFSDIEVYSGEFLQGFFVKQSEEFEQWVNITREKYKELYIKKLNNKIEEKQKKADMDSLEKYIKLLISVDEYNEEASRMLMRVYSKKGAFNKAIDIYNRLIEKLENELGITPDARSIELLEEILDSRKTKLFKDKSEQVEFFYGREEELNLLKRNFTDFICNNQSKSALILGEAGIGKSRLKDKFIETIKDKDVYVLQAYCYQAEEKYALKPWNTIFSDISTIISKEGIDVPELWANIISHIFPMLSNQDNNVDINLTENIDTLKFKVAEEAIFEILKIVSYKVKLVLVIEDLQWIDEMSLSLLNSFLLHSYGNNLFFIGTCREEENKSLQDFITSMVKYNKIDKIIIERFTKQDTINLIKVVLPDYHPIKGLYDKIYKETDGNTFFLMEFLNSIRDKAPINIMSSKMQDILKSRFLGISEEQKKLLNMVSLFFDEAPLELLTEISGKEDLYIVDTLQELQDRCILKEDENQGKITFKFTHIKLREFIYLNQSSARRKILHNKVAYILERSLKKDFTDILIYSKLIYHFISSGDKYSALKYSIKNASTYLDFNHELFPVIEDINNKKGKLSYLSDTQVTEYLTEIEDLLYKAKENEGYSEVPKLEIAFLHLKGRYLIREGKYTEGIKYIEKMIDISLEIPDYDYALKGYRQIIYYCIQIENNKLMSKYVELALKMANENKNYNEEGILLRLKGLNKIMCYEYEEAEYLLKRSISIFESMNKNEGKYLVNIAAAYNYIGDIRKSNMDLKGALEYYNKAIYICTKNKVLTSLSLFNTNAAVVSYEVGNFKEAKAYLKVALEIYEKLNSIWGRAIAESYMCLIDLEQTNYTKALQHLKKAEVFRSKIKSPKEQEIICKVKKQISEKMKTDLKLREVFFNNI